MSAKLVCVLIFLMAFGGVNSDGSDSSDSSDSKDSSSSSEECLSNEITIRKSHKVYENGLKRKGCINTNKDLVAIEFKEGLTDVRTTLNGLSPFIRKVTCTCDQLKGKSWTGLDFHDTTWSFTRSTDFSSIIHDLTAGCNIKKSSTLYCRFLKKSGNTPAPTEAPTPEKSGNTPAPTEAPTPAPQDSAGTTPVPRTAPVMVASSGDENVPLLSVSAVSFTFKSNPGVSSCRCEVSGQPAVCSSTQLDVGWNSVTYEQQWGLTNVGTVSAICTNTVGEEGTGTATVGILNKEVAPGGSSTFGVKPTTIVIKAQSCANIKLAFNPSGDNLALEADSIVLKLGSAVHELSFMDSIIMPYWLWCSFVSNSVTCGIGNDPTQNVVFSAVSLTGGLNTVANGGQSPVTIYHNGA